MNLTASIVGIGFFALSVNANAQTAPLAPAVATVPVASRSVTDTAGYIGRVVAINKVAGGRVRGARLSFLRCIGPGCRGQRL